MGLDDPASDPKVDDQRDLIYCLFAVQIGCASAEQFIQAGVQWVASPDEGLAERLRSKANIDETKSALLDELTEAAIRHHGGDVNQTIQELHISNSIDEFADLSIAQESTGKRTKLEVPLALNTEYTDLKALDEIPGRYTHRSEYSRGGMGRILLVHDQYLSRDIALKELLPDRLRPSSSGNEDATPIRRAASMIARFLREAKITSQLEHPNIVPVYELGSRSDGTFYYTMKLIRGETFADSLSKADSLDARLKLLPNFVDLCKAVAYAHSRQVVHRDIKPSNIMLGPFGETVLIDWGLAKVVGKDDPGESDLSAVHDAFQTDEAVRKHKTGTGVKLGTPAYMSPEQARGDIAAIDARSDVFSLGIMLYEILTGDTPYGNMSPSMAMQMTAAQPVQSLDANAGEFPEELVAICNKTLSFNPEDRYVDADALLKDLQNFVSGALVSAHQYTLSEILGRFYARNRDAVRVGLAAILALAVLSVYSYISIYRERDEAVRARNIAEELGYANSVKLAQNYVDDANLSAAQDVLNYAPPELRRWEWHHLQNRAKPFVHQIVGAAVMSWLPSGQEILTVNFEGQIAVHDVVSGDVLYQIDTSMARPNAVAVDNDGALAAVGGIDNRVWIVDLHGRKVKHEFSGHRGAIRRTTFSPDGTLVATGGTDGRAVIWNADTGEEIGAIQKSQLDVRQLSFDSTGAYLFGAFVPTNDFAGGPSTVGCMADAKSGEIIFETDGVVFGFDASSRHVYVYFENDVKVYDVDSGEYLRSLDQYEAAVTFATLNDAGNKIVTCDAAGNAIVRDVVTGAEIVRVEHGAPIGKARLNAVEDLMATVTRGGTEVRVWDLAKGIERFSLSGLRGGVFDITFSPDGEFLAATSTSEQPATTVYRGKESRIEQNVYRARSPSALSVAENRAVISSGDGQHEIFDIRSGMGEAILVARPTTRGNEAAFVRDDQALIFPADSVTLARYAPADGQLITPEVHLSAPVTVLEPVADGMAIVTATWDGKVSVRDAEQLSSELMTAQLDGTYVTAAVGTEDSDTIILGTADGQILRWQPGQGEIRYAKDTAQPGITAMAVSPDRTTVLAGRKDGGIIAWEIATGKTVVSHQANRNQVRSIGFGDEGQRLFTVSARDGVNIWAWPSLDAMLSINHPEHDRDDLAGRDQYLHHFFSNDTGVLYTLSAQGYLTRWTGATDDAERASMPEQSTAVTSVLVRAIVARGDIETSFGRIASMETFGPVVTEIHPMRWLGLREGDVVSAINGARIEHPADLTQAAHKIVQSDGAENLSVTARGENVTHEYTWTIFERNQQSISVEVSLTQLKDAFKRHRDIMRWTNMRRDSPNSNFYHAMGIDPQQEGLKHGLVLGGVDEKDWPHLRNLGLAWYDRLTGIAGVDITSPKVAIEQQGTIIKEIEAGVREKFSMVVQRGEFREVTLHYTVKKQ